MKLAICLFGNVGIPSSASQRKNVDLINESSSASTSPKVAFEGFKKNFLENYKTDLFIHSWSENYKDLLCKFYKPKNFLFEPQKIFKPKLEDYGINNSNNISDWNISNDTKLSYSLLKDGLDKDSDLKSLLLEFPESETGTISIDVSFNSDILLEDDNGTYGPGYLLHEESAGQGNGPQRYISLEEDTEGPDHQYESIPIVDTHVIETWYNSSRNHLISENGLDRFMMEDESLLTLDTINVTHDNRFCKKIELFACLNRAP